MACLCVFVCVLSSRCLVCRPSHVISIQRQKRGRLLSVIKHLALQVRSKLLCCPMVAGGTSSSPHVWCRGPASVLCCRGRAALHAACEMARAAAQQG